MSKTPRSHRKGFTLLELVIALALSSIVLIGVFSMMASMVQYEAEGLRKGSVNGWSLASLVAMNREIEGASVLVYPTTGGQDTLVVCSNWSRLMTGGGGVINTNGGATSSFSSYCWDSTSNILRRKVTAGACPNSLGYVPPACTALAYGGASSMMATGVYRDTALDPFFTADPTSTGTIRIRYIVGNPAAGASPNEGNGLTKFTNPQSMAFDTRVTLDKAVGGGNSND
jgi:prepilin-type N-terminal cleavage/methylation domain-containing protein